VRLTRFRCNTSILLNRFLPSKSLKGGGGGSRFEEGNCVDGEKIIGRGAFLASWKDEGKKTPQRGKCV